MCFAMAAVLLHAAQVSANVRPTERRPFSWKTT
jgi:hypothetical protein